MHGVQICGLLSLVFRGLSVCLLVTTESPTKTTELIKMLFMMWICVVPGNDVLGGGLIPPRGRGNFWGHSPTSKFFDHFSVSILSLVLDYCVHFECFY